MCFYGWLNQNIELFNLILLAVTAFSGIYFGYRQTQINKRLKDLEDYVAVSVVPGNEGTLKIHNVGKINLFLFGFTFGTKTQMFEAGRLLSVGTGDVAHYWLPSPSKTDFVSKKLEASLFLKDQFGKKYITKFGGQIISENSDGSFKFLIYTENTHEVQW